MRRPSLKKTPIGFICFLGVPPALEQSPGQRMPLHFSSIDVTVTSQRTLWSEHDRYCDEASRFASLTSEPPLSHPWGVVGILEGDFVVIQSPLGLQLR